MKVNFNLLFHNWWTNLTKQQRILLQLLCATLMLFIYYEFVWQQLEQHNQTTMNTIEQKLTLSAWLHKTVTLVKNNQKKHLNLNHAKIKVDDLLPITQQYILKNQFNIIPAINQVAEKTSTNYIF